MDKRFAGSVERRNFNHPRLPAPASKQKLWISQTTKSCLVFLCFAFPFPKKFTSNTFWEPCLVPAFFMFRKKTRRKGYACLFYGAWNSVQKDRPWVKPKLTMLTDCVVHKVPKGTFFSYSSSHQRQSKSFG